NGVQHGGYWRRQVFSKIIYCQEVINSIYSAIRINVFNPGCENLSFQLTYGARQRRQLPVDVRDTHIVEINQGNPNPPHPTYASSAHEPAPPKTNTATCRLRKSRAAVVPYAPRN